MHARGWPPHRWWFASLLLAGSGLAGSVYLLGRVFALLAPARPAFPDICSVLFLASCDGALADDRFWILNVPLAGWGVVHFSALAALLLLARFVEGAFEAEALFAACALASIGAVAGLALTAAMLLGAAPICPLCLAVHATSLALAFTLQAAIARPLAEQLRIARASVAGWLRPVAGTAESARWPLVGFGCAAMMAVVVFQWVYVESGLRRPKESGAPDPAKIIASYESSPRVALPVTPDDPHRGPLTAPVQLVVFESLRCAHCQRFASTLSRLQSEFGDRLLVVYKHYPLSTRCNERLGVDMQPGACELAWAAVAAQRQARFWQFHDAVMAPGARTSSEDIARTVRRLRLNPARFEADLHSDVTRECVAEDVALGNRLQLPGTPSAFLDGRLVSSTRLEVLEILVRHQLEGPKDGSALDDQAARNSGRPLQRGGPVSGG